MFLLWCSSSFRTRCVGKFNMSSARTGLRSEFVLERLWKFRECKLNLAKTKRCNCCPYCNISLTSRYKLLLLWASACSEQTRAGQQYEFHSAAHMHVQCRQSVRVRAVVVSMC